MSQDKFSPNVPAAQRSKAPIMIGVVSGDMVHADFCFSLTQMFGDLLAHGFNTGVGNIKATIIDVGRNMVVTEALRANCSHILFVDSDMAFSPDAARQLLSHDKDIVGVTYCTRRPPFVLVHHNLLGEGTPHLRDLSFDHGIYPVASLPCGLMLIKTDVFRKIMLLSKFPFLIKTDEELGEDTYFCRTARDSGYEIYLDVDLSRQVRHCGQHYYSLEDAKPADQYGNYLKVK